MINFNKLGIEALSPMQEEAFGCILRSRDDVVVLAPTGSGKTLAYLWPICHLLKADADEVQALVIVPGRELALQSHTVMTQLGSGLRSQSCYGGRPAMDEHRELRKVRPQIVFGTPGRLNDHLDKGNIAAEGVRYLVIDEFDKCLEMGFLAEMKRLITRLPALERRILLSATEPATMPDFVRMGRVRRLDYREDEQMVSQRVEVWRVCSAEKDKLQTLRTLLLDLGSKQSVVFVNYRESVTRVTDWLTEGGFSACAFHGGMEQKQRERAIQRFSNHSVSILVATDLASRGLDMPGIDQIIHYHLPQTPEALVHRVGRTARWEALGKAFFIVGPEETMPDMEGVIVSTYVPEATHALPPKPEMTTLYIGKGKDHRVSRGDIVGFLCKKANLSSADIGRIDLYPRYCYVAVRAALASQVLHLVQGEKIKGMHTVVEKV